MLLKLFHEIKREGIFPNSFYRVLPFSITLILKLNKTTIQKGKLYATFFYEHRCKILLKKKLANQFQQRTEKITHHYLVGLILGM
jgi:hypothetical protein